VEVRKKREVKGMDRWIVVLKGTAMGYTRMCREVPENRSLQNVVHRLMILMLSCVQSLVVIGSRINY